MTYRSAHDIYRVPVGAGVIKPAHLRIDDVADIGGVQPKTISQHLYESLPERVNRDGERKPAGKYADDPFPPPDQRIGKAAVWSLGREAEIRAWFDRHPRRAKGDGIGGRRPRSRA